MARTQPSSQHQAEAHPNCDISQQSISFKKGLHFQEWTRDENQPGFHALFHLHALSFLE
jgi:hypothetical protein